MAQLNWELIDEAAWGATIGPDCNLYVVSNDSADRSYNLQLVFCDGEICEDLGDVVGVTLEEAKTLCTELARNWVHKNFAPLLAAVPAVQP
jgi:hypothetical protein